MHDKWLEECLFGTKLSSREKAKNLVYLENASYLFLDLCNNAAHENNQQYQSLKEFHIPGFPTSIQDINSPGGGTKHREYAHLGWDKIYEHSENSSGITWSNEKFIRRKKVLLATVEKVFEFRPLIPDSIEYHLGYSKKCEAFSALVYYIHLLGDHREMQSIKDYSDNYLYLLTLAHENDSLNHKAVLPSIVYCIDSLVTNKSGTDYTALRSKLLALNKDACPFSYGRRSTLTDEQFELYKVHIEEAFEALAEYLPNILQAEDFFLKAMLRK